MNVVIELDWIKVTIYKIRKQDENIEKRIQMEINIQLINIKKWRIIKEYNIQILLTINLRLHKYNIIIYTYAL